MLICARETWVCPINRSHARLHFHDQCLLQNANVYLAVHQPWLCVRTHRPILIVAMETECCQRSPHSKRPSLSLGFHSPPPAASVFLSAPLHFCASCLSIRSSLGSYPFQAHLNIFYWPHQCRVHCALCIAMQCVCLLTNALLHSSTSVIDS